MPFPKRIETSLWSTFYVKGFFVSFSLTAVTQTLQYSLAQLQKKDTLLPHGGKTVLCFSKSLNIRQTGNFSYCFLQLTLLPIQTKMDCNTEGYPYVSDPLPSSSLAFPITHFCKLEAAWKPGVPQSKFNQCPTLEPTHLYFWPSVLEFVSARSMATKTDN